MSDFSTNVFSSYEALYEALNSSSKNSSDAAKLLYCTGWFLAVCEFDGLSGDPLPFGLDELLKRIDRFIESGAEKQRTDRLGFIIGQCLQAVQSIVKCPNDKIERCHELMPTFAAREVDSRSVQWLSRQPGRNLRQKLSGKGHMMAVKRRLSLDTTENRLFKDLLQGLKQRLFEVDLESRAMTPQCVGVFVQTSERWLNQTDTKDIAQWGYWPPNNTLLQDKHYRKIWDAWLNLQYLDEQIRQDHMRLGCIEKSVILWSVHARLARCENIRFIQQPCALAHQTMKISPKNSVTAYRYSFSKHHPSIQPLHITLDKQLNLVINKGKQQCAVTVKRHKPDWFEHSEQWFENVIDAVGGQLPDLECGHSSLPTDKLVAIELCATSPVFTVESDYQKVFPTRLLLQIWRVNGQSIDVDCSGARAIKLTEMAETFSIRSILGGSANRQADLSIAKAFCQIIKTTLGSDELIYLLPDYHDEFSLQTFRTCINFYFKKAEPLPKSIAAVIQWQSSKCFRELELKADDLVIVLDRAEHGLYATVLIAKSNQKLKSLLPDTQGIFWERHPAQLIGGDGWQQQTKKLLRQRDCVMADALASLFSVEDLSRDSGKLSVTDDNDQWFHLEGSYGSKRDNLDLRANIMTLVKTLPGYNRQCKMVVLSQDCAVKRDSTLEGFAHFSQINKASEGAIKLKQWQRQARDIPLWVDHLPELSMEIVKNGILQPFFLVKNVTVDSFSNKALPIEIKSHFTLAKGEKHYQFPLHQGGGKLQGKFQAYLVHPSFPLSEDTDCRLKMIYRYGADNPYELTFEPVNPKQTNFKQIKVLWQTMPEIDLSRLYPEFPKAQSWLEFRHFTRHSGERVDLLEWMSNALKPLGKYRRFFAGEKGERVCVKLIGADWFRDRKGMLCCKYVVDGLGEVFIHQNAFEQFEEDAGVISFDIEKGDKGVRAGNITLYHSIPENSAKRLAKSLRFVVFTLFNNGHSLTDPQVPLEFRQTVIEGVENALALLCTVGVPKQLQIELKLFLSCLHKDAPVEVAEQLLKSVVTSKGLIEDQRYIAYSIGDASCDWQQKLLQSVLDFNGNGLLNATKLTILSIALWRYERLLNVLTCQNLLNVCRVISDQMQFSLKRLSNTKDHKVLRSILTYLELLLALLRTRGSADNKTRTLFLSTKRIEEFTLLIDLLIDEVNQANISLKSRISLNLEKPEVFYKTPDIIYALKVYLSGERGANTISVVSVSDE